MSIVNSFKAYVQITRMAANAEERTSQLEPLSGLVVRVSMKPVSTMQIGSGQNGHCGKGSAIDFVADAKVEAYAPPRSRDKNKGCKRTTQKATPEIEIGIQNQSKIVTAINKNRCEQH